MNEINEVIKYFNKLEKITLNNVDLNFGNRKFIKKNKIDDIMCCILAKLPEEYKNPKTNNYRSVSLFKTLYNELRQTFFLMPGYYMIDYNRVSVTFNQIKKTLIQDIDSIERNNSIE